MDPVPAGPPREVRGAHFVRVEPTPLDSPRLDENIGPGFFIGLGSKWSRDLAGLDRDLRGSHDGALHLKGI